LVRAAVDITPPWAREILGLDQSLGLPPGGALMLHALGATSERIVLEGAPPALACVRMGLGRDYLYR
jgi:uncharacterized protein (DUF2236 family)